MMMSDCVMMMVNDEETFRVKAMAFFLIGVKQGRDSTFYMYYSHYILARLIGARRRTLLERSVI